MEEGKNLYVLIVIANMGIGNVEDVICEKFFYTLLLNIFTRWWESNNQLTSVFKHTSLLHRSYKFFYRTSQKKKEHQNCKFFLWCRRPTVSVRAPLSLFQRRVGLRASYGGDTAFKKWMHHNIYFSKWK